ncbi:protein kinase-like domain-containing protein [Artemisia annua]|uniref:Protein kinase-like domain-containing protein n=1 Tax=Artemisia annua TaxID=35608 RepID=A0A2U1KZT7_ARTAN|nr:protein kinase-like domain-containing protein [Artemisia annua]
MVFRFTCFDLLWLPRQILNNDDKTKSIYFTAEADFPENRKKPEGLRVFTYLELTFITRDFEHSSKKVEGEFGSIYEGPFIFPDRGNRYVFIKKLKGKYAKGHKQWVKEVKLLGSIDHPNLVKLVGYCVKRNEESGMQRFLVYENIDVGISLGGRIFKNSHPFYDKYMLGWTSRLKVALAVACGLACLHEATDNKVAFGDFNHSNVHLCRADGHISAKLSNFRLHQNRLAHVSTEDIGNMEYIAPEYIDGGNLTSKSDVWSYGVFLFELISGNRLLDTNRPTNEQNLIDWVKSSIDSEKFEEITDARIDRTYSLKSVQSLCLIANMCLTKEPKSRPEMRHILEIVNQLTLEQSETASPAPPLQSLVPKDVQHTNSSCLPRL